mmetsp:Transcript_19952/g.29521  ORF Transcript_19952/g.29521 Transcript_19952/m.29521 type:complete len:227 (+) Transcript_19952:303-983(+)
MNGTRLGLFVPLQKLIKTDLKKDGEAVYFFKNLSAGALSGAIGAVFGSPFFLVKARLQGQSKFHAIKRPQGAEVYDYKGMFDGFRKIIKKEKIAGLFRGVDAAVPRVMAGSAAQLSSYNSCKNLVISTGWFTNEVYTYVASSMVAGLVVTTVMNPFDVVSTRMYNQSKGNLLYSSPLDCASKTFKMEGARGLFKGWAAHYFRLGPHTVFTFTFLETFQQLAHDAGY